MKEFLPHNISFKGELFERACERIEQASWFDEEWICKTGIWPDSNAPKGVALKLLKPHWSNDVQDRIGNASGIFFSIWTDETSPRILRYNIHAFKLRELKGYKLESRKFAEAFRTSFSKLHQEWPNLRTDFGPQTLMEGFQERPADALENTIVEWSSRFPPLADLIDALLKTKKT